MKKILIYGCKFAIENALHRIIIYACDIAFIRLVIFDFEFCRQGI